jgi:6-phosphogluconolactonase (cycloisomerase 2 family)
MLQTPSPEKARQRLQFPLIALMLITLAGCGGGGGGGGGGSTPAPTPTSSVARFAYLANFGDNTVSVFIADNTTGRLRHHGYVPSGDGVNGDGPAELVIDPSGQFAYTINTNSTDISLFVIDSLSGALSADNCDTSTVNLTCGTGGTPVSMAFGSSGQFAYVANQGTDTITVHSKNASSGSLSDINAVQSPVDDSSAGSSLNPVELSLHPSGDFLYSVHNTTSNVTIYTIDPLDGTLTAVTGSPVASGGTGAVDIAITPDGNFAYVANTTSGDIGIFTVDATGLLIPNTTSALLSTGGVPQALAIDPTGQWLYMISKEASGSVSLFSIESDGTLSAVNCSTTATCPAGNMPESIAIDPTGQYISVANSSGNTMNLYGINQTTGQLLSTSGLITRSMPSSVSYYVDTAEVTVTPRFAYVGNYNGNSVSAYAITASSGALSTIGIPTGTAGKPTAVATDLAQSMLYVTNETTDNVSAFSINSSSGALTEIAGSPFNIETNPTGPETGPIAVSVDPSGRFAYVANSTDTLSGYSVDSTTGALSLLTGSPFATGDNPSSVTVDPTGRFLYNANINTDNVSAFSIDTNTGALSSIGTIAAGDAPNSIVVDPSGRFVYVANNGFLSFNVSAYTIDPLTGALSNVTGSPFSAGSAPISISVDPLGEFVYVANRSTQNVTPYTINQSTGALTAGTTISTELNPQAITVDLSGQYVFVANGDSNSLSSYTINSTSGELTLNGTAATGIFPRSVVTTGAVQ